jgi:hypothetical protein
LCLGERADHGGRDRKLDVVDVGGALGQMLEHLRDGRGMWQSAKSIGNDVVPARVAHDLEVELGEADVPSCNAAGEVTLGAKELEALVVCQNSYLGGVAPKMVAPFLDGEENPVGLEVAGRVIPFRVCQRA